MKHFYLIVNKEKENAEKGAEMIAEYLSRQGCECLWDQEPPDTSESVSYTHLDVYKRQV